MTKSKKGKKITVTDLMRREALNRAEDGESVRNYDAIYEGFAAKGIEEDDILPRENIFTYNAWLAKGRQVRKGEKGVKIEVFIPVTKKDEEKPDDESKKVSFTRAKPTTVFHISQTDPKKEDK